MKMIAPLISTCMLGIACNALGGTNLFTSVEVWSGTNVVSLVGGSDTGASFTQYSNKHSEVNGYQLFSFSGNASSRADFVEMNTSLGMILVSNTYPQQYVQAFASSSNTLAVAGPVGSGSVQYSLTLLTIENRNGTGVGVVSNSFFIKHNGTIAPCGLFYDATPALLYTTSVQTIVFGEPFTVSFGLFSELGCWETQSLSDYSLLQQSQRLSLTRITVRDAGGAVLNNSSMFTVISDAGQPYPKGPKLFLDSYGNTNIPLFWHSIAGKEYRFQACTNLINNLWTNIGSSITGSGTTNHHVLPITDTELQYYRLGLP